MQKTDNRSARVEARNGVVIDVRAGTLYIEEKSSAHKFFSTFGRIKGYRGESKDELSQRGLQVGRSVRFTSADNERIDTIELGPSVP